ncbi:HNH endonuclease [Streptomyces niveiscabiei]|uniref:phosphorothioated DNA-binding restriction endonuclease n=1 Tax=Streptomyces niveiscabiei TaxID=164115 RepID=UPI0029AA0AC8|nr:HNH endonuclease [Streptomyces niveiscabiei]MDX3385435.1 HNH endonuclease [Streptomyces niveiscabiei]
MDWLERVADLRQWTRHGVRAPHKPLLLLYALGRFQRDAGEGLKYSAVEGDLKDLLAEYGPTKPTSPSYPFHHLTSDGLWEVRTELGDGSPGSGVRQLRESGATGRLAPELRSDLRRHPELLGKLARLILEQHFPPSLHAELCEAVGLDLDPRYAHSLTKRQQRDPRIRELVLRAYDHQCAFCGYDGLLGSRPVGLEAAHVRWWSYAGPDTLDNALCLCALHHKLFDKGVLGISPAHRILVSPLYSGTTPASRTQVTALADQPLRLPDAHPIAPPHREWHTRQVFRTAA